MNETKSSIPPVIIPLALLLLLLLAAIILPALYSYDGTSLEVYTPKDVYYIEGLEISSESGRIWEFKHQSHLRDWFAETTANEVSDLCLHNDVSLVREEDRFLLFDSDKLLGIFHRVGDNYSFTPKTSSLR